MQLHGYWKNGAVIQQDRPYRITGWEDTADRVTATLYRQPEGEVVCREETLVESGCFCLKMPPVKGSFQQYKLEIMGSDVCCLTDLCFGEVWLTAGQSNMEFSLGNSLDRAQAEGRYSPWIRYLRCERPEDATEPTTTPRETAPLTQLVCGPWNAADSEENAAGISAIGFYLASEILKKLHIPVGVVNTAMGGTTIEAWMSRENIEGNAVLKTHLQSQKRYLAPEEMNTLEGRNYTQMTGLFNERIAPLAGLNFRAAAWLQGESSAGDAGETDFYREALKELVACWRKNLQGQLPFFVLHIAAENYQFSAQAVPRLNEAISRAVSELPEAWEVPVYDLPLDWNFAGRPGGHPIHPSCKFPYGMRLARIALWQIYSLGTLAQAPVFQGMETQGNRILIRFAPVAVGLECKGRRLHGFTICGESGVHLEADAEIVAADTVAVYHPAVVKPVGVSYGFALYNQRANLTGCGGIPVVPFRQDVHTAPVYTEPREWLWCDSLETFQSCFEPALGGAGNVPLWKAGSLGNVETITCEEGIAWTYHTEKSLESFVSIAPQLQLAGRWHNLETADTLSVTIFNPNDWEKTFVGVLVQTLKGKRYYLPIRNDGTHTHSRPLLPRTATTYMVDLKRFLGCYLMEEGKMPADLSDAIALEFVFRDTREELGRLCITGLTLGFDTGNEGNL